MLSQSALSAGAIVPHLSFPETVQSRFGEIAVDVSPLSHISQWFARHAR